MLIRNEKDLNKSNCNRFKAIVSQLQNRSVTVGIHKKDNKPYPDSNVTTAEVGKFQEFGTSKLPPRIWLRIFSVFFKFKKELDRIVNVSIKENSSADAILKDIGGYQKERIKERILDNGVYPHSNNATGITLVDKGQLVSSVDCEVH